MKVIINRSVFLKTLQKFISITEKKIKNEILCNILFSAEEEGKIVLIGTDLEIGIKSHINATVLENGSITITPKKIYEILKDIDDEEISISSKKDNVSEITTSLGKFNLLGQDVNFYPRILFEDAENYISINCFEFSNSIACVLPFVQHNDSTSPALSGVFFDFINSELTLVSTDTHRLSIAKVKNCLNLFNISFILPRKGAEELKKIIEKEKNDSFKLGIKDNKLVIQTENDVFICRFIEANYPPYRDVVPKNIVSVILSTKSIIQRIKNVSIISSSDSNTVKFLLSKDNLKLTTDNRSVGSAELSMDCTYSGEEILMVFNIDYLLSGLQNISNEATEILIKSNETAVEIHGLNDDKYKYIVMPLKLENISY